MNTVVINFGMGNIRSICHKMTSLGIEATVAAAPADLMSADLLILPGVGYFAAGMENLRCLGLVEPLNELVLGKKIPVLGICLGMQLFTQRSEEGDAAGLGWIDAETVRFRLPEEAPERIPHVGWNTLIPVRAHRLLDGIPSGQRFYFVHSYHVLCHDDADVLTRTHHGLDFVSSVQRENIFGVQFHPEKSHPEGMRLIANFVAQVRRSDTPGAGA